MDETIVRMERTISTHMSSRRLYKILYGEILDTNYRKNTKKRQEIHQFMNIYFGMMIRVFANGPEDLGSILGRVIPKTQKMVLDAPLLNTQHYKVQIKGKVEQYRERSSALPYTLV